MAATGLFLSAFAGSQSVIRVADTTPLTPLMGVKSNTTGVFFRVF
jgi:hypothetical protein